MHMWLKVGTKQFDEAKIKDRTAVEFFREGMAHKEIGVFYSDLTLDIAGEFYPLKSKDLVKVIDLKQGLPEQE